MTKGKHITTLQTSMVIDRLREVIEVVEIPNEQNRCRYKQGDDSDVAALFGISKNSVARVRAELYGNLYHEPKEKPTSSVAPTREELAQGLQALANRYYSLEDKYEKILASHDALLENFDRLITTLSLNKVHDVRHLAIRAMPNVRSVA